MAEGIVERIRLLCGRKVQLGIRKGRPNDLTARTEGKEVGIVEVWGSEYRTGIKSRGSGIGGVDYINEPPSPDVRTSADAAASNARGV